MDRFVFLRTSVVLSVLAGAFLMSDASAQPFRAASDDVAFSAEYSQLDFGWDSGWWPGGGEEPGGAVIQVRLNFKADANVHADVAGQYVLEDNQLAPGAANGQWDYALGVKIYMKVAFNINFTIPNPFGDDFVVQPFIIDIPFMPNTNLMAEQAATFENYLLDSTSELSQTTESIKIYGYDLVDLIIGQLDWPDWIKTFINGEVALYASFQIDGALGCDNMTASDGNVFTSEGQQLPVDISVDPYQANLAYNENFTWDVVVHAIPSVSLTIIGTTWTYPVLDIPWQVYQGPLDLPFTEDSLTIPVGGGGEGEGEGETEGEGESCPVACEIPCDGTAMDAGVADALTALYGTPQFACEPTVCDNDQNGLVDVTQVQLLDFILANPGFSSYCCVRAAWDANGDVVQGWLSAANTDLFSILSQGTFQTLFTGLATDGSSWMIDAMVGVLAQYGVTANVADLDRSAAQYLAADGDADLDGVCNLAEYNAMGGDAEAYLLAAIDPSTAINGGGCFPPCFSDPFEGEGGGEDTTPPEITVLGSDPVTVECNFMYLDEGAIAYDETDGDITEQIVVDNPVNTSIPNTYIVTYNVSDAAGNPAVAKTRTVYVADTRAPVITLLGDAEVTVECGAEYTDAGVLAADECDGDMSAQIQVTGAVNTAAPGTYTLTASVSDSAGNAAEPATRTIHVVDTQAPVLTLLGDPEVTLECGGEYTDEGVAAMDVCDGDISGQIQVTGEFNPAAPGTYVLTAMVPDGSGNEAEPVTRTIHVQDTQIPTITLTGESTVTVPCGAYYTDAGATAWDSCAGDITSLIQGESNVDTSLGGEYHVTFTVSDPSGNAAAPVVRTVIVDCSFHKADQDHNGQISISELLRVIQLYNSGGYHCDAAGEDGYAPGPPGDTSCAFHSSDYAPADWSIGISELLRIIQFYNSGGYHPCAEGEDGYCPGV